MKVYSKQVEVTGSAGITSLAVLNGVAPHETLTPKLAERAALIACGHRHGVTVWDWQASTGYRLYPHSHRKLTLEP